MVGSAWIAARGAALGLLAAALAACASVPAPVSVSRAGDLRGVRTEALPPPPAGRDGPARVANYAARLQCVPYARAESGIEIYGDAHLWWDRAAGRYPRSQRPAAGAVFVMRGYRDANRGHVAVVREIENSRLILVDQANWLNGGEISVAVPVLDVSPNNDWSQVRVWYIPGNHWGGRVYEAQGFIHPFTLQASVG